MAEFFNRKEEVIYFEFTPHGRRAVAAGDFRPVFYSFHDADVIYDGDYCSMTEPQNAIKDRIKEAPRLKFIIPKESETSQGKDVLSGKAPNIHLGDIGTCALNDDHPSFEIVFLSNRVRAGSYSGSYVEATGSTVVIPQLGVDYVVTDMNNPYGGPPETTYENVALYVKERNSKTSKLNFEIEVYEKEENGKFIRIDPEDQFTIRLDKDIEEYQHLADQINFGRGDGDNRLHWIKALKQTQAEVDQDRGDIYEIDDPGEVCD